MDSRKNLKLHESTHTRLNKLRKGKKIDPFINNLLDEFQKK